MTPLTVLRYEWCEQRACSDGPAFLGGWGGMLRSRAILGPNLAASSALGQEAIFAEATSLGADANIAGGTIIPKVFP